MATAKYVMLTQCNSTSHVWLSPHHHQYSFHVQTFKLTVYMCSNRPFHPPLYFKAAWTLRMTPYTMILLLLVTTAECCRQQKRHVELSEELQKASSKRQEWKRISGRFSTPCGQAVPQGGINTGPLICP